MGFSSGGVGSGDVVGPGSATDNAIARYDGTSGKTLQEYTSSAPTISDLGALILNEGQLTFPATANPSADANTLDDYEEGTFTPTISDNSLDGTGECQVYSIQVGRYTKIGHRVFIQAQVTITDLGSLDICQGAHLTGLPFTALNVSNSESSISIGRAGSLNVTAGHPISGDVQTNSTEILVRLWDSTAGVTTLTITELSIGANIFYSGSYEV